MILSERDLENYICQHQENFIKFLKKEVYGEDCDIKFLGRQVDLGNRQNIADLIYYYDDDFEDEKNRHFIIVELKYRNLQPRDLSQISRYMNLLESKLEEDRFLDYDNEIYGLFVSFGFDDDMKNISMLDIKNIDYISIENLIKFKNCYSYSYNDDYVNNLKIDDRIEKLYLEQKESDE